MSELYQIEGVTYTLADIEKIAIEAIKNRAQLKAERDKAWFEWEALNLPTFERDYEEDYSNTVARLNAEGYYDGLNRAVAVLEGRGE